MLKAQLLPIVRVILVYNPDAGRRDHESDELREALSRHGDDVSSLPVQAEGFDAALVAEGVDLLVAAGGDGTAGRVIRAIAGRTATPLLILPIGTANNIARSLGIEKPELDLRRVKERWVRTPIDAARCDDRVIVEGAGCGVLAAFMRGESDDDRAGVRSESKSFADRVETSSLFDYRLVIDGTESCGEALLIEALVMRQLGPNVVLAPDANPGDGMLDVIVAREEDRAALLKYLRSGGKRHLPALPIRQTHEVTIACDAPWHFDDEPVGRKTRTVSVQPDAWQAMLPKVISK